MVLTCFTTNTARYRVSVASRIVAAVVGGYVHTVLVAVVFSGFLSLIDVLSLANAVFATTMGSFIYYAVIVLAVFHARSATRAWLWLAGSSLVLGLLLWGFRTWGMGL
ncbi:MAG: hypothetical protein ACK5HY_15000 [Parahaliea sp.]